MPLRPSKRASTFEIASINRYIPSSILRYLVHFATFPYYRVFRSNTLKPIILIAQRCSDAPQTSQLAGLLSKWRERKLSELYFISIGSTALAGAVIGSFSWVNIPNPFWLNPASWYCSLFLAALGLLLSAQQATVLEVIGDPKRTTSKGQMQRGVRSLLSLVLTAKTPERAHTSGGELPSHQTSRDDLVEAWSISWKMLFMWQCPIMFLSYSVCLYLLGLTIYVCSPLISGEFGDAANAAYMYLACAAIMSFIFVMCSFWVFQNADLEFDDIFLEDSEPQDVKPAGKETNTGTEPSEILKHRAVSWKPMPGEEAQSPKKPSMDLESSNIGRGPNPGKAITSRNNATQNPESGSPQ